MKKNPTKPSEVLPILRRAFLWSSRLLPRTFPFCSWQAQRWVWIFSCFRVLLHLPVRACAVGIPFASSRCNRITFRPIPDGFLSTSLRVFDRLRIFLITLRHKYRPAANKDDYQLQSKLGCEGFGGSGLGFVRFLISIKPDLRKSIFSLRGLPACNPS